MCKVKSVSQPKEANSNSDNNNNSTSSSPTTINNHNNNSNNVNSTNNNNNNNHSSAVITSNISTTSNNYHHQQQYNNWKNCSNRFVSYSYSPTANGSYGRPFPPCPFISYSPSVIYLPVSYPTAAHPTHAPPPPVPVTLHSGHLSAPSQTVQHHHHHHQTHPNSQQHHQPPLPPPSQQFNSSSTVVTNNQQVSQLTTSPSPPPTITPITLITTNVHTTTNNNNNYIISTNNYNINHSNQINSNNNQNCTNSCDKLIKSNDLLSCPLSGKNNEALQFLSKGAQVIVRMRGLPYDCTDQKVIEFFASGKNGCEVMDGTEGVLFVRRGDGRPTGDAFVLFDSEEMAIKALHKHRESIGSRYIELFRSSTAEVQQVLNRAMDFRSSNETNSMNLPQIPLIPHQLLPSGSRRDCIRLRGLPYEAQVEQILEFLGENAKNIVFRGVHMVYNAQGQPSGEAFIQMDSEQSAAIAAAQRHHKYMSFGKKQRYIEVFQCSIDDMNLVLTGGVPLQRHLQTTGTILPAPYRAYPYPVLPAGTVTAATAAVHPTSYYHPIIYWPYPSPPVSPTTYYTHTGPTMITSECIQIPPPPHRNGAGDGTNMTNSDEGLVTFTPRIEAERAIQEKNRANIGNRCIELYLA